MSAAETTLRPAVMVVYVLKSRCSAVSGIHGVESGQSAMLSRSAPIGHADTI